MTSQRSVLIVDDSPEDCATFRRYLQGDPSALYVCHAVATAAAGLEWCRAERPDAILLDYDLPDDNGLSFLADLIAEHGPSAFAIVMLTASGDEAVAVKAMQLGAQDYLAKSAQIEQPLRLALASALDKVSLQRQIERQRGELEANQRRLEQALAARVASELQLRMALQSAGMATWEWDLATNQVRWGAGLEDMLAMPTESFGGSFDSFFALVHPDDQALVRFNLDHTLYHGAPYEIEFRMLRFDGSLRWAATRGYVVRDAAGAPLRMIGVDMDVTQRKQAELELRRREAEFKTLVENAPDIIARFDRELRHVYVSPSVERVTGLPRAAFIGKTNRELGMPNAQCEVWDTALQRAFATGSVIEFEFSFVSPSATRHYRSTLVPELSEHGEIETVMAIARDVTAYKQAEQRLRFLSDISQALAAVLSIHDILNAVVRQAIPYLGEACIIDIADEQWWPDGAMVAHVDAGLEEELRDMRRRYPPLWHSGHPVAEVLRTGRPRLVADIAPAMIDRYTRDARHRADVLRLAPKSFLSVPIVARGQPVGVLSLYATRVVRHYDADDLALVEDVARRAALALDSARQYQEAQGAIEERDAFLSIASHELKNPLTSLLGRAQLLQRRLARIPNTEREQADVNLILSQGKRINTLLADLLDVSRLTNGPAEAVLAPLDLGALVRSVAAAVQLTSSAHAIRVAEGAPPLLVAGDAGRLEQVFHNLLSNAIKYSPAGGPIAIELRAESGLAQVIIRDSGLGIPPEALPHVFRRFYRVARDTGGQIAGSGIGLYVVKEIVASHHGTIHVASAEGQGSTFTVQLPLLDAES